VTAATCAIVAVKAVNPTSVCAGSDSSVTYTFTVSNPGSVALTGVTVSDDKLGSLTADFKAANGGSDTIAAGGSVTFTETATINATTTNIVTATGTALGVTASDTDTATVTAETCSIQVTKAASPTSVCTGANTLVTYTYHVINTGSVALTGVTVSDDTISGAQAAFTTANGGSTTLAVGANISFTLTATINATTTNIVTATGSALGVTASDTDTATVTAQPCGQSALLPTQTTCQDFLSGTATPEETIFYGVRAGKINNVSPGVLFYYTSFDPSGTGTVVIHLTQTMGDSLPLFGVQSVQVFTGTCGSAAAFTPTINSSNPADVTITLHNVTASDTFIANIKIDPSTVVGSTAPNPSTVAFTYATVENGTTLSSVTGHLQKK
jgi:uncharacterized repeat protein (TIGR01451 family)